MEPDITAILPLTSIPDTVSLGVRRSELASCPVGTCLLLVVPSFLEEAVRSRIAWPRKGFYGQRLDLLAYDPSEENPIEKGLETVSTKMAIAIELDKPVNRNDLLKDYLDLIKGTPTFRNNGYTILESAPEPVS